MKGDLNQFLPHTGRFSMSTHSMIGLIGTLPEHCQNIIGPSAYGEAKEVNHVPRIRENATRRSTVFFLYNTRVPQPTLHPLTSPDE